MQEEGAVRPRETFEAPEAADARRSRTVLDTLPVLVWTAAPDGAVLFFNRRWHDYTGLAADELTGATWAAVFHVDDLAIFTTWWRAILACEAPGDVEARLRRSDGTYRWFRFRAASDFGRSWYGTGTDIDARWQNEAAIRRDRDQIKTVQDALAQSEAFLAEAQRLSHTGSFGWRVSSGEIIWSEETFRIFGCPTATPPTLDLIYQRTHPDDRARVHRFVERVTCEGRDWDLEHRLLLPDGSVRMVHVVARATKDAEGNVEFVGAVTDVSERKRSEYMIGQVFEMSPDGLAIVGRDYRYRRVNPIYERNFSIPAARIARMHVRDLLGEASFEQTVKPRLDRCFGGEEISYRWWVPKYNIYQEVHYSPLRPDTDRVEAVLVTTRNLTEQVRATQALHDAREELARVSRITTAGELTAAIAHEVGQPLAAIAINAQTSLRSLDREVPDLAEARAAIDRMQRDCQRAGAVINGLRALARKSGPELTDVDLNGAIREVVELLRSEMEREAVVLSLDVAPANRLVTGDRVQLQQVLINLARNGIEAMSAVTERPRLLQISAQPHELNEVIVAVADTGGGLDAAHAARIFDPFFTTKKAGMGIGLSVCRSIIEAHRGRLWASPNRPHGAVFSFTIPLAASPVAAS